MDSRLVIRQIKTLSDQIKAKQIGNDSARDAIVAIAADLTNPYLLCIPELISCANAANVDASALTNKIVSLKK